MRVGIVRSDIGHIFLQDVESRSQRCFSSEPAGQSRYFHKPTDAELNTALATYAILTARGTNTSATVNTSTNKTLRIRTASSGSYTSIDVTSGAATAKTTIAADLNAAFALAGLNLVASVDSANKLLISTVSPNAGPGAALEIDTVGHGSNLNTAVGFTNGGEVYAGLTLSALKAVVYPTATTVDVSSASIVALSTFSKLISADQNTLVAGFADLIAPTLIETGQVLLSFAQGNLYQYQQSSFQPGGSRSGLPAGIAAAILDNDGVTAFTL